MKIKINNFSDGVHSFELVKSSKDLGLDEKYFGDVVLDVLMDKSHSQIVLKGDISAKAKLVCDRCNEEYNTLLKNSFQLTYLFNKDNAESENINLYYIAPDTDKIVLDDDVRDFTILAEPMKNLCSEDCKGLCFRCGKNLNKESCNCSDEEINEIWTPLLKLKNKN